MRTETLEVESGKFEESGQQSHDWASQIAKVAYPVALAAALSIWFLALRAPLWLDETLSYWQVSGGFSKIWSRSALMPSSIGYLYTLWFAKSVLGASEVALRIPSLVALLAAVYFLFRAVRHVFDSEVAFLACTFFCLEGKVVFAATDARPYAFALLATNLALLALVRWISGHQLRQAVWFGAAAACILYFHYLYASVLPAFALYYLIARWRSLKEDVGQIAAAVGTFVVLTIPLAVRIAGLYSSRDLHTVPGILHPILNALNTLAPRQTLIGFGIAAFLAALVRKIKLPESEDFPTMLLGPILALVPAALLFTVSSVTTMHLVIPRYFSVVAPGSALLWAMLATRIDSRFLRLLFCVGLVGVTTFEVYSSPYRAWHEVNFKEAHALVNSILAKEQIPVMEYSAFIESNYQALPTDRESENALNAQMDYYPVNGPVTMLPISLSPAGMQMASEVVQGAAARHQSFLVVAAPNSMDSLEWLAGYARTVFTPRVIGRFGPFNEVVVVEFYPVAELE